MHVSLHERTLSVRSRSHQVVGRLRDVLFCHCANCRRVHGHVSAYTSANARSSCAGGPRADLVPLRVGRDSEHASGLLPGVRVESSGTRAGRTTCTCRPAPWIVRPACTAAATSGCPRPATTTTSVTNCRRRRARRAALSGPLRCYGRSIIGREHELATALAVLGAGRHLLLEGPVGVGKTTVALAVCGHLGPRHRARRRRRPLLREQAHRLVRPAAGAQAGLRRGVVLPRAAGRGHARGRACSSSTSSTACRRACRTCCCRRSTSACCSCRTSARCAPPRASRWWPRRTRWSTSPPATSRRRCATASSTSRCCYQSAAEEAAIVVAETGSRRRRAGAHGGAPHAGDAAAPALSQGRVRARRHRHGGDRRAAVGRRPRTPAGP